MSSDIKLLKFVNFLQIFKNQQPYKLGYHHITFMVIIPLTHPKDTPKIYKRFFMDTYTLKFISLA
ncbi:hypothetical protein VQ01_15010 [Tamlana sp. s12]|nr:hypothetical protein VQ01_15010 [Tamlana sp. s12]